MKVYPRLAKTLYAVYVGAQPRAKLKGLFATKKEALFRKKRLKRLHAISLKGGSYLHVVVVSYDQRMK